MGEDLKNKLRRYTNLSVLIRLLSERQITLVDPSSWDDANDSRFLAIYKQKRGLKTLLALCFTYSQETYHHWHVFASGPGGACITFNKGELLDAFAKTDGIRHHSVKYARIDSLASTPPLVKELPFLKRAPYEPEKEFRVIYESTDVRTRYLDVDIPLSCIERITLSPWLNKRLKESTVHLLRRLPGCSRLPIHGTTLISNDRWQEYGENAV